MQHALRSPRARRGGAAALNLTNRAGKHACTPPPSAATPRSSSFSTTKTLRSIFATSASAPLYGPRVTAETRTPRPCSFGSAPIQTPPTPRSSHSTHRRRVQRPRRRRSRARHRRRGRVGRGPSRDARVHRVVGRRRRTRETAWVADAFADPDAPNAFGRTALVAAALKLGNTDLCLALLSRGANPNVGDEDGETALYVAAFEDRADYGPAGDDGLGEEGTSTSETSREIRR